MTRERAAAWLDPVVVALVAWAVYLVHGFDGVLGTDLGTFVYGGEHVARGTPPYDGIFNSVGPLADALPGLAIWLGHPLGLTPVFASRLAFSVVAALCPAVLYLLARRTFGSRTTGWLAAALFLTFGEFIDLATNGPREKTPMVLFLLVALLLVVRGRWWGAGAMTALATLTWQPAFVPLLFAAAIAVTLSARARGPAVGRFVLGGAVPTLAMALWFVLTDTLGLAFQGFVVINAGYTEQSSVFHQAYPLWPTLYSHYGLSLWLVPAGLLALLVLGAVALRPGDRLAPEPAVDRTAVLMLAGAGLAATVWTAFAINGGPDLFVLLPFAALGLAGLWQLLFARVGARTRTAWLVAVCAFAVAAALVESTSTRSDRLVLERHDVRRVLAAGPREATVLSVHAPEVLALTETTNLSRWQLFSQTMTGYLDHHLAGGLAGYARRVERAAPTFVVVGHRADTTWLRGVLNRHYVKLGAGPAWTWYVAESVGPRTIRRLRDVNAQVMRAG